VHSAHVRRARAGFRKFSGGKFMHRGSPARRRRFDSLPSLDPDVAIPLARRDHRKSKFGVHHAIKRNDLYGVTNSEFCFPMIPPEVEEMSTFDISAVSFCSSILQFCQQVPFCSTLQYRVLICTKFSMHRADSWIRSTIPFTKRKLCDFALYISASFCSYVQLCNRR
jgi:hypothetical protein